MKLQIENLVKLQNLDREIANMLGNEEAQASDSDFDFDSLEKLDKMRRKRVRLAKTIDKRIIRYYERLKGNKGDKNAVVPVVNAVCQGCNISVPTSTAAKLQRKDSITTCDHCGRFIYSV
ncbi:MAG: C4-type zinc ribbon domain-containing protein [Candidatus Theseobacter exili]|nr:C4-type zinc ribbon domain-containing protein [Candidatus Theseobacter exili]